MDSRSKILPLLAFDDVWQKCDTKPFDFVKVMKHSSLEELESLRVFTAMRTSALENRNFYESERSDDPGDKIETYLFHLMDLYSKECAYWTPKTENQLNFYWTSPLADRSDFMRLKGIDLERSMVMFLHGCARRQRVHLDVDEMMKSEGERAARVVECVKALRSAAGVFKHTHNAISGWMLFNNDAIVENRPTPEVVPEMSACFEKICLGEAQTLVAFRALEKKTSPSVIASLFCGASDLLEEASSILRLNTGKFNTLSEKLRRFLALNSSLQQIRAYQCTAASQRDKGEAGMAVAYCQKARHLLETCEIVAETDERWQEIVEQEQRFLTVIEGIYDQDRVSVFYQPIADQVPRLSDGKRLVVTMDYKPHEKQPFL